MTDKLILNLDKSKSSCLEKTSSHFSFVGFVQFCYLLIHPLIRNVNFKKSEKAIRYIFEWKYFILGRTIEKTIRYQSICMSTSLFEFVVVVFLTWLTEAEK